MAFSKTFIIAEIGINHNGSLDIAKKLIDIAHKAGVDAVKFQKRAPDICVPESVKNKMRETPWGEITYLEYRKKVEFGEDEYKEIDAYCNKLSIPWFASAWDFQSLEFLEKFYAPFHKIPSALLTYTDYLIEVAKIGKLTFISTGMSTIDDIKNAVNIFNNYNCPFVLMHCVSSYPANIEDLNLSLIQKYQEMFGCDVGYSGHEAGLTTTFAAVALGAIAIERHITLDRSMWGTDHSAAVEPQGLDKLVKGIRAIEKAIGKPVKRILESEKEVVKKLRYFS